MQRERGAALVLVAVAMAGLFTMAAIALDLSNVRNTRQENKSTADLAVAAGLQGLTEVAGVPVEDGTPRPWSGVCKALDYLEANQPDLVLTVTYKDGAGDPISGDPCTSTAFLDAGCVTGDETTFAWIHATDGAFTVDIKSGYETPDVAFDEDLSDYSGDDGDPSDGGCDQLAVIVNDEDPSFFGKIVGKDEYATTLRSVGRLDIVNNTPVAVAMVLLEQEDCEVLNIQGGGTAGQVVVRGTGTYPGIVHADSDGTGSGCGAEQVIDGKNKDTVPLVRALSAPSDPDTHGILSTFHGYLGGSNGASWTSSRSASATEVWMCDPDDALGGGTPVTSCDTGPTGRDRATRTPADERYLDDVTALRSAADAVFDQIASGTPPSSWTRYSSLALSPSPDNPCDLSGKGNDPKVVTITASMVTGPLYVDCSTLHIRNNWTLVIEDGIDEVYFQGGIGFAGDGALDIRDPSRVLVYGVTPEGPAIRVTADADLAVNRDGYAGCEARQAAEPSRTTELVLRTSSLQVVGGGTMRLCSTFVHLMGGTDTPAPVMTTGTYPAPYSNTQNGTFDVAGGGVVEWTAPNTNTTGPPALGDHAFEDLAAWTEAQPNSRLAGGGTMLLTGIYFLPNAGPDDGVGGVVIAGSSGSVIQFDAQLWARKVSHEGGATFVMRSNPDDSIKLPFFGGASLVR